jgi:putative acetyltransferase
MTVSITIEDPRSPDVEKLLRESHTLMQALFSAEENHFLSVDELCVDEVSLFIARIDGVCAGSGALSVHIDYGEVKSMYTNKEFRGHGVAGAILSKIEDQARAKSLPFLRLETGDLLHEAQRLYNRHDFHERGPFGDYEDNGSSIFLEKTL